MVGMAQIMHQEEEERQQGDGQDVLHLDENVQRGASSVLERVAYRVADNR